MDSKLTLKLNEKVIDRAKKYASNKKKNFFNTDLLLLFKNLLVRIRFR